MEPYISIVAAARNDDHGGDLLERMQVFINVLSGQVADFGVPVEIVVVEWNPLPKRSRLFEVLDLPRVPSLVYRFIAVPREVHEAWAGPDSRVSFYQMPAKNVGIRRSRGRFVLSTCVDLLYDERLIKMWADRSLETGRYYRATRHDLRAGSVQGRTWVEMLDFCRKNVARQHEGRPNFLPGRRLHTAACGDFTLLSRDDWFRLRGYHELRVFSYHVDSLFLFWAHSQGVGEVCLPWPIYHIEHGKSATNWGRSERERLNRMRAEFGEVLSGGQVREWAAAFYQGETPFSPNGESWGLAGYDLPETTVGDTSADLTLYAVPKPFVGEPARHQRNALRSWAQLKPRPRIVLVGDEQGIEACAREIGADFHSDIARNEHGTPLLSGLFDVIRERQDSRLVGLVNSDIILPPRFAQAIERVRLTLDRFLLIGKRSTVPVEGLIDFDVVEWWSRLVAGLNGHKLDTAGAIDYFVFSADVYDEIPPLAIGRTVWDNWLVGNVVPGTPIVNASPYLFVVHPEHGYGLDGTERKGVIFGGPEAQHNRALCAGQKLHSCNHATWLISKEGIVHPKGKQVVHKPAGDVIVIERRGYVRERPVPAPEPELSRKERYKLVRERRRAKRAKHPPVTLPVTEPVRPRRKR